MRFKWIIDITHQLLIKRNTFFKNFIAISDRFTFEYWKRFREIKVKNIFKMFALSKRI